MLDADRIRRWAASKLAALAIVIYPEPMPALLDEPE